MNTEDFVILVDENDRALGTMEKMEAHEKGLLHRAFSVFVFNNNDELLLQQRAETKYHSGGLWTNTCCSHPRPEEETLDAAFRRMEEEMGMSCVLEPVFQFTYKAALDKGLWEHEFDHVFIGRTNALPEINPEEVMAYRYASIDDLRAEISAHPERFTVWFKIAFDRVADYLYV